MKSIDSEITAVENRIAARKVAMGMTAQAAKTRAKQIVVSPPALAGAAVLGFLIAGGMWRRRKNKPVPTVERRRPVKHKEPGKAAALGTLAMTGVTWLIRSQFGGPVGLAQFVVSKIRSRQAATGAPAQIPR